MVGVDRITVLALLFQDRSRYCRHYDTNSDGLWQKILVAFCMCVSITRRFVISPLNRGTALPFWRLYNTVIMHLVSVLKKVTGRKLRYVFALHSVMCIGQITYAVLLSEFLNA